MGGVVWGAAAGSNCGVDSLVGGVGSGLAGDRLAISVVEQTAIAPDVLAAIAQNVDGVKRCDRVRSRGIVGQFVYLQMHLIIDHRYEPLTHEVVRELEAELRRRYGALQVTFYVESDRE